MSNGYGGGFDHSMGEGGFSNDNASSQGSAVRSSMTPVTIKQINDASQPIPDANFSVYNVELNMISFVGVLRKVDVQTSAVVLTVEDGSGSIELRKWINASVSTPEAEAEKYSNDINKYVHVGGALKEFQGKKNVQNVAVYSVTDHNQVLYHNLSAIENHLKKQGVTAKPKVKEGSDGGSLFVPETAGNSMEDRALQVIRQYSNTMLEGVPATFVAQKLNISPEQAKAYCDGLSDAGQVYIGTDDTSYICI
ncbi:uncharacterized protein RJT20DRAFT_130520 [Scheffersomyces xylosifermentans]|uniref:uncharacterized protein n=1 Tax=Scheffersomyces xylosifermentans TaxID=1304137 RepID=UPI00315CE7F8